MLLQDLEKQEDQNELPVRSYVFGEFVLDTVARTLTRNAQDVHLPQRPFAILEWLIRERDRVVTRNELLDKFWEGHDVYDDALRKCIGSIRKALGDTSRPARLIETRYGGGYRFIGEVKVVSTNSLSSFSTESTSLTTKPRFARMFRPFAISASLLLIALLTVGFYVLGRNRQADAAVPQIDSFPRIRTIAVMPLKNLTGNSDNEYFSDGVTDSIITELARANDLKVISRTSTFSFKGREADPRAIGRELGADALLEGTVQGKGDTVNIRVRLINAADGSIIWTSNDFERQFSSASDLQDIIACNVAAELRAEICGKGDGHITRNGLAYQEYLKGRFEWNKRTAAGITKSIEHFNRAIAADPKYALAYSGLAESYIQGVWHVPFDSREVLPKAREFGLKAVSLDPNIAETHTALASVYSMEWNWNGAVAELDRAIEIDPKFARAHHVRAFMMMILGRHDEAIASIDRAAEFDPANMVIKTDKGNLLSAANRIDEAFEQWDRTIAIDPTFVLAREHRIVGYERIGNDEKALSDYIEVLRLKNTASKKIAEITELGRKKGFRDIRRREFDQLLARKKRGEKVSPTHLALYSSLLGDADEAFRWLDQAVNERNSEIVLILDPVYSLIQTDPRYPELLSKIGLVTSYRN